MSFFSAAQQAEAAGEIVTYARLVEAEFASGTVRQWEGAGELQTTDGKTWQGAGSLLSIGDLHAITSGAAVSTDFGWTGVTTEIIKAAREAETEAKGRAIRVYGQFLDGNGQVLDAPWVVTTLIMDVIKYNLSGATGRTVSISAEGLLTGRKRPAYGRLTDTDQKKRNPGDRGLELMGALVDKTVTWPDF